MRSRAGQDLWNAPTRPLARVAAPDTPLRQHGWDWVLLKGVEVERHDREERRDELDGRGIPAAGGSSPCSAPPAARARLQVGMVRTPLGLLAACVLAACSGSGGGSPTASEATPTPLAVSISPASAVVEVGATAEFTLRVSGGAPGAAPSWTCTSSDTAVATASDTASGCTATGVAAGSATITAKVTRGSEMREVTADLEVEAPTPLDPRNRFTYWDADGDGDLTCAEARGKDGGLRLPAYRDDRNGTGLIYRWLERRTSSDSDDDGIACEGDLNPDGYVPDADTLPPTTGERRCPAGSPRWMDLPVCEEGARIGYDRDAFGSAYGSLEDEIIESLPKSGGSVYTPYTCKLFDIRADGTADTDIEHIVALAEAYDSGLPESDFLAFGGDIENLTIADPAVNRDEKSDRDAGEWGPPRNRGWFAARVVAVKQKYDLSVNPAERDALKSMLDSDPSREVACQGS